MTNSVEELMTEIAKAFFGECGNALSANISVKMLWEYAELDAIWYDHRGSGTPFVTETSLSPLFERLREAMYNADPTNGAWFVAKLTINSQGNYGYDFDYEDLSQFDLQPTEKELAEDLKRFPRAGSR